MAKWYHGLVVGPDERKCCRCKTIKPKTDFYRANWRPDGLENKCKACCARLKRYYRYGGNPPPMLRTQRPGCRKTLEELKLHRQEEGRKRRRKLRMEVLEAYGRACECCGESNDEFLCVDHVNGDGAKHRRQIGNESIYKWLKRNGFPKTGFRLLCWNCNCSRGSFGYCPHESGGRAKCSTAFAVEGTTPAGA